MLDKLRAYITKQKLHDFDLYNPINTLMKN